LVWLIRPEVAIGLPLLVVPSENELPQLFLVLVLPSNWSREDLDRFFNRDIWNWLGWGLGGACEFFKFLSVVRSVRVVLVSEEVELRVVSLHLHNH
jgi:hypothetical protein